MSDPLNFVNARLGVGGPAHCLIGPYRPNAMLRLGPDSTFPQPTHGYDGKSGIGSFSHTHVAGTGGSGRYGNIGLIPFTGKPVFTAMAPMVQPEIMTRRSQLPKDENTQLGHYQVNHQPHNIQVDLAATEHVGLHRYAYPKGEEAWLIVDTGAAVRGQGKAAGENNPVERWETGPGPIFGMLEANSTNTLSGRADLRGGWGHDKPYSVYFFLESAVSFSEIRLFNNQGEVPGGETRVVCGSGAKALVKFPRGATVDLKVGISFVSVAQARARLPQEVAGKDLTAVVAETREIWRKRLATFRVDGSDEVKSLFYSLIYRLYCLPTDLGVDEENPHWQSGVRHLTDFYCLWDSVRNANSFFHLFDPEHSAVQMNAMLDIAEHQGFLADAHVAGHHAFMQSACAADVLFSEAKLKNIPGVDYRKALEYVCKNVETTSPDPTVMGRNIADYHTLGYTSTNNPKFCVSMQLEYT